MNSQKPRPRTAAKKKSTLSLMRTLLQKELKPTSKAKKFGRDHFHALQVIGKGGFGRVWKVEYKRNKEYYAMKEMLKLRVVSKRSVHSVMNERKILEMLNHPFIVNMQYAFQDRDNLYLVLDLLSGGDLRYQLCRQRRFTEEQTRFFVACLVLGLEYLHVNGIIHRDIKPENLVLDSEGYLRITDFGVARVLTPNNAKDTSGTPGYMAPEVLVRQNHGIEADYFAVGVIVYEFMMGQRPYIGRNRNEIRDHVLSKQVQIRKVPDGWSPEAADFANQLIQRKASRRLGANGPHELKSHPWLRNVPWRQLLEKALPSPFIPGTEDNFDERVNSEWIDDLDPTILKSSVENLFTGYEYDSSKTRRVLYDTE